MNGSIRIGNLFGIPFFVHPTWFFILGLVTLSYSSQLGLVLGLIVALSLFASVLAHELGHSFAAIRQGIEVKSITLFLFGGLANLAEESKTPSGAFWVAIAGPLVSFLLFGLFTFISLGTGISGPLAGMLALLGYINLALGVFNLIPGLPLDGGNVLKALVWKITGNPFKGVIFAGRVGQIFGVLGITFGLSIVLGLLGTSFAGGWWYALIGWFLFQNAGRAVQYAKLQDQLTNLKAEEAVNPNSPIVLESMSLRKLANDYVIGKDVWRKFLVIDETGRLVGEMAVDDMRTIATDLWPFTPVRELTKPVDQTKVVSPDRSLLDVAKLIEQNNVTELPVVQADGVLVGLLEKDSIAKLLENKLQKR
ncbi:site-2 protease family protein [Aerosakkonemataceae cyanobacterium BLCC-F154]|uniref:Zinc metalloprotease n=1 Tax=Floridaenema fluviatile BLCC-F154 TaxID=3153640 RepID=A0ABV4Y6S2_9CYAN